MEADPEPSRHRGAVTRSMRRQLLLLLLGAVAIVWIATAAASYVDVRHELDELLDAHLAQSASLLITTGRVPFSNPGQV